MSYVAGETFTGADGREWRQLVDEESGEYIEVPAGEDNLAWIVYQRHDANRQVKAWEKRRAVLDQFILAEASEKAGAFADVSYRLNYQSYGVLEGDTLATGFYERYGSALDRAPKALREGVLALLASVSGIKADRRKALPEPLQKLVEDATVKKAKNPFVTTEDVRKRAPEGVA